MTHITKIKDQIEIVTIFHKNNVQPFSFKWIGKKFIIEKINLVFSKESGTGRLFSYSVTSQGNYFKLTFDTNKMKWYVEEHYEE